MRGTVLFDEKREVCHLPAFFNAHVHLGEDVFRGISGKDWTLRKYLSHTEAHNASLTESERAEEWRRSAKDVLSGLRQNWTVGFCAGRAASAEGIERFSVMAGYPIMKGEKLAQYRRAGLSGFKLYREQYESDSCSVGVFLHSLYASDEATVRLAASCMDSGASFLTVHVAEDEYSAKLERDAWGCSGIEKLKRNGLLTDRSMLVHAGVADECDLDKVAEAGAAIAICPISNRFLNTKTPDVRKLNERGIPWFLCSDGTATGRTLSLLEQAAELKRSQPWVDDEDILLGMTVRPARFYGKRNYTGLIGEDSRTPAIQTTWPDSNRDRFLKALFGGKLTLSYDNERMR